MKYYATPLISGKHYSKNLVEFDYIEPKAFKDIYEKTNARVIGSICLKEANEGNNDVIIIKSNGHTFQYKIDHTVTSNIMGYILVSNDTYIAVRKDIAQLLTTICIPVICCAAICGIAVYVLWRLLSGAVTAPTAHISEPQGAVIGATASPNTLISESQG